MPEMLSNNSPAEAISSSTPDIEPGFANDSFAAEFELAMDKLGESETADASDSEIGRDSKVAGVIDNVAESMNNFANFVEKTHKNRLDLQEEVSASLEARGEAIKKSAKSAGRGALGFFKKLGTIGAAIGTTTLGAAIIGAETVGKKAGEVKDYAEQKVQFGKDFASEKVETGKAVASEKIESVKNQVEAGIENARQYRQDKKAEALVRKQERQDKREAKQLEAKDRLEAKIKNRLIMESIRKNNAEARKAARQEKVENIKDSIIDKKAAVAGGVNRISGSALNFLKRAKSAGEAAVEDWKNYDKDDVNHKTSL